MLELIYTRSYSPLSYAIRALTAGRWSHCGVIVGDVVVDAIGLVGVRAIMLEDLIAKASSHMIVAVECPDPDRAINFALRQVGKPYDWFALIALPLRRSWLRDDAWFCSELAEATLAVGGNQRFRSETARITPQHSWMVA